MNRSILASLALAALSLSPMGTRVAHADDLAALKRDLQTGDDAHADEAAKKLAASKDPKAVDVIYDALALGVAPRHALMLLGGLGGRKDARSIEVLTQLAHNRNADLRKQSVALLGVVPDPKVVPVLVDALSDTSPDVRAQAAGALGKRKEKAAQAKLMQLLERQDPSAPAAVAAIATPEIVHKLTEKIGPIPDALLCDTFGEILKRADFGPDPLRVEIVNTLAKIPTPDSTLALTEYMQASQKDPKRPSRLEAEKIVNQRNK